MLLIELGECVLGGREGVGGELGELAAPEFGAQDALGWHPVAVDGGQDLDGAGIFAAHQHPIGGFEIADGTAHGQGACLHNDRVALSAGGQLADRSPSALRPAAAQG